MGAPATNELENLVVLSSNVRLYVPSTFDVTQPADNTDEVRRAAELMSEAFGGATAFRARGCWKSTTGGLVTEEVTVVESYCSDEDLRRHIVRILGAARAIKHRMQQEAVALEVNGRLYLV